MRRHWAVLFVLVFGSGVLLGEQPPTFAQKRMESIHRYAVRTWDGERGLPQSVIFAIAQTPDGYLWLGMESGLVRFDGTEFKTWSRSNTAEFLGGHVTALWADPDGTLWVGSSGGLTSFAKGKFTRHPIRVLVNALARGRDGALWVGTAEGLVRFDQMRVQRFGAREGLPDKNVLSIAVSREGAVYAGTQRGAVRWNGARFVAIEDTLGQSIKSILPLGDGRVWMGTAAQGIVVVDAMKVVARYRTTEGLPHDAVYALRRDREGTIWIGTNGGGVARYRDGRFETLNHANGLPSDLVWALHDDADGAIWAGANGGGLARLSRGTFTSITASDGLSSDIALPIYEDARGDVWVGTAGAGVNQLRDGKWIHHDVPGKVVLTIGGDRNGNVWVGTPQGLTRIRDGAMQHIVDGLPAKIVTAVLESRDGSLWIGTNGGGVARMKNETILPAITKREGLSHDSVLCLLEHRGETWVGTRGGGITRILRDGRVEHLPVPKSWPSEIVFGMTEDRRGAVWIAREGGVSRYANGAFAEMGTEHGLPDDGVSAIVQDGEGNFWLSSNRGIFFASEQDLYAAAEGKTRTPFTRFGLSDGMKTAECNGGVFPPVLKSRDGTLWFPTIRGVVITDGAAPLNTAAPAPMLTSVLVDQTAVDASKPLKIAAGVRRLEIQYAAVRLDAPERVAYQYRLDGADAQWVDAGAARSATYSHLPHGEYRFRVRASANGGPWSVAQATLPFRVDPRWYRTWWFYLSVVLAIAAIIAIAHRSRTRHLRMRAQLLEERERAAVAIHESEAHFRAIIENAGDLIVIVDGEGVTQYVSPSVTRLLHFDIEDLSRKPFEDFVHREDVRTLRSLLQEGESASADFRLRDRDGTWRAFHALAQRIRVQWLSSGILLSCRDVTERQQLQQQLEQAHRVAGLGRLAATVAHEFNNVLMGIQPFAEMLERYPADAEKTRDYGRRIAESARRGRHISDMIVRYTRDLELEIVTFEVSAWMEILQAELRALLPSSIELRMQPLARTAWVSGDPALLTQVFVNLTLNARDAMGQGGILEIRATSDAAGRAPVVKITVEDSGVGIADDVLPRIFEPLFTTKKASGTGLGLSIAHHIVTKHEGAIFVDSELGSGTAFHIVLPQVEAPAASTPAAEVEDEKRSNVSILLIEDDLAVSDALRTLLEIEGYVVETLDRGNGAEEVFLRVRPDVVVLDIGLPDVSGEVVLERLLSLDPEIPIIVSTGHGVGLRFGENSARPIQVLQKPYDIDTLIRAVADACRLPQRHAG